MANDTPGERSNASAKCQQSADDMKTIKHTNTLVYYDGVQVFAGQDAAGDHYLGAMIDTVGDADRYLVVAVAPDPLRRFTPATSTLGPYCWSPPSTAGTPHWWTTILNDRCPSSRSRVHSLRWTTCQKPVSVSGKRRRTT